MKNFFLLYCLILSCFFGKHTLAQDIELKEIINTLNNQYSKVTHGSYDVTIYFKHWSKKDTSTVIGKLFFTNKSSQQNSIANFILYMPIDSLYYFFNGKTFYYINFKFKYFEERNVGNKNLYDVLNGSFDYELIDWALISNYEKKIEVNSALEIRKNKSESSVNTILIEQIDTNRSPRFEFIYWEIDTSKYHVLQKKQIISSPKTGTTYKSYNYSPVARLDSNFRLENLLPLDSLKKVFRYKYKDYENPEVFSDSTLKAGTVPPMWTLKNSRGEDVSLAKQKNNLTLIDFFYNGCIPCLSAIPQIIFIQKKYADKLTVYGINPVNKNDDVFQEYLNRNNIDYEILFDEKRKVASQYHVTGYPTLFLIDNKANKIIYVHRGFDDKMKNELDEKINEYLK